MPVETRERRPPTERGGASIVFHPRHEQFLKRCGVDSSESALDLPGEVVCGHPDRHVVRVELMERVVYVKREHLVGLRTRFRNARAGFGWVSRCEREAMTLRALEAAELPGPKWLAYGRDRTGRAFLIVDELTDAADLHVVLREHSRTWGDRRVLAQRLGRAVARLHEAGFATPELAAKHVFVNRLSGEVTLIDWQSASRPAPVAFHDRVRQLAALDSSLNPGLASPRQRLRFVHAYLGATGESSRFREYVRTIAKKNHAIGKRSSVRDQHLLPAPHLVWLAGEAVCARPDVAAMWPKPAVCEPFYQNMRGDPSELQITLADGQRGRLLRYWTTDPLGRLVAAIRERPWRSPAANAARLLFHLERHNIAAPRLLAFGQRFVSPFTAESFLLVDDSADRIPVSAFFAERTEERRRREVIHECRALLRKLHDAGCRVCGDRDAFAVLSGSEIRVALDHASAVRLTKRVSSAERRADLRTQLRRDLAGLNESERALFLRSL